MKKTAIVSTCLFSAFMMFGCLQEGTISGSDKTEPITLKKTTCKVPESSIPSKILPGYTFQIGIPVYSPDRSVRLVFQSDGNLVLYKGNQWIAQTHTYDHVPKPDRAVFQTDGNLVLYKGTRPVWNSQTWGNSLSFISVYNSSQIPLLAIDKYTDGGLVSSCNWEGYIYTRLWKVDGNIQSIFPGYEWPNW